MKKPDIDMQSKRMMVDTKAYSEMIDALIVAREQVLAVCKHNESLNNGEESVLDRKDLQQIEQALTKAGVEL